VFGGILRSRLAEKRVFHPLDLWLVAAVLIAQG
jgi:hypothetical protein